jgi:hypothetical protein
MLLAQADSAAAQALCGALMRAINEDRIWVYYQRAPLVPILRQADLEAAGCSLQLPTSRVQVTIPGQEIWISAIQLLQRMSRGREPAASSAEAVRVLRTLSQANFSSLGQSPPFLYHNDFTASVPRFYWSEDIGYALWLRLYFENERLRSSPRMDTR